MSLSLFSRSELTHALGVFRTNLWALIGLSMVANLLMLTPTTYMLQVYDRVLISRSETTLLVVSGVTLFFISVMAFAEWLRATLLVQTSVKIDEALSERVFNASFHAHLKSSNTIVRRALNDLLELRQFLTGHAVFAFFDVPWTPIYIGVLFLLHPSLGWIAIAFAIIQSTLAWFGNQQAIKPTLTLSSSQNDVNQFIHGKMRNAEPVEAMGMYNNLRWRWWQRHQKFMLQHEKTQRQFHTITAWSKWVRYCQQSIGLAAGALLVVDGQLSPGAMIASNVLLSRALAPVDLMVSGWKGFLTASLAFRRLDLLLEGYPERESVRDNINPQGYLRLSNVSINAPGKTESIIRGITLNSIPGQITVVIGPSGSGKSTLARALLGIWPTTAGQVLIDSLPISEWDRKELGHHLGYLPQDIEVLEGTIAENIARFGTIESEKVIAAAKASGLHDMILRMPNGYDTQIQGAGHRLSGGQRQRIALARALYGEPAILVLDEPNANLDDQGEKALVQAISQMKALGKNIWLITHRTSVIHIADQLVLLRAGEVKAAGPKNEILNMLNHAQGSPA